MTNACKFPDKHQFSWKCVSQMFLSKNDDSPFLFFCSEFCHTLKWNGLGFTCVPHPNPPSHLPLHPLPPGLPSAPGPSACLMHPTWAVLFKERNPQNISLHLGFYILKPRLIRSSGKVRCCVRLSKCIPMSISLQDINTFSEIHEFFCMSSLATLGIF